MKTYRTIAAAVAAAVALCVCALVLLQWSKSGASAISMLTGCVMHSLMIGGIWFTIDNFLKEREQR